MKFPIILMAIAASIFFNSCGEIGVAGHELENVIERNAAVKMEAIAVRESEIAMARKLEETAGRSLLRTASGDVNRIAYTEIKVVNGKSVEVHGFQYFDGENPGNVKIKSEESTPESFETRYRKIFERDAMLERNYLNEMGSNKNQEIREFMNSEIRRDPATKDLRSKDWQVKEENGVIYIREKKNLHVYNERTPFGEMVKEMEKEAKFSACVDISSNGEMTISLNGELKCGIPFEIKFQSDKGLEVQAVYEGSIGGESSKPVSIKVVHKEALTAKENEESSAIRITSSFCYPYNESQVELSMNGVKMMASPKKELSFEF